jgi:hypothetical protein
MQHFNNSSEGKKISAAKANLPADLPADLRNSVEVIYQVLSSTNGINMTKEIIGKFVDALDNCIANHVRLQLKPCREKICGVCNKTDNEKYVIQPCLHQVHESCMNLWN